MQRGAMFQSVDGELRVAVRVQPRARSNEVAARFGNALKIRLTAPPVDGAANAALVAFLGRKLGVSRSAVRIISGTTSRDKVVGIRGVSLGTASRCLVPQATTRHSEEQT